MEAHPPYALFPIVSCGVDWLTCTSNIRGVSNDLEDWAYSEMTKRLAAAGAPTTAKRLGFEGHSINGLFVGRKRPYVMVQLSGPLSTPHAVEAISWSTNVSRVDLQVTVFSEGERPHLAQWTRARMLERPNVASRPGRLDIILGHPDGETLQVNRRCGDQFGRLYDKTAEAKLGEPLTLWRYEVEWKGKRARALGEALASGECNPTHVSSRVHDFWTKKGVQPAFACPTFETAFQPYISPKDRSVLDWFRESVSITVSKAIAKHGRGPTLDALGLAHLVQPEVTRNDGRSKLDTLASDNAFDATRSENPERLLLH